MTTENNSFIELGYLENPAICDLLINLHKQSDSKGPPYFVANGVNVKCDPSKKDSTDFTVYDHNEYEEIKVYIEQLQVLVEKYIEKYKYCNSGNPWAIIEPINIQHYAPGQGYHAWHYERTTNDVPYATRHLVFMTYLNDVTDAGETEWFYQNLKIQPRKGLTVLWPVDWTHTHRGVTSPTQEKYIITGWFNYMDSTK